MKITKEFLDRAVGDGLVPCYEQCREFGILFPASKRWRTKLEGRELDDNKAERILSLKDKAIVNPKLTKNKLRKSGIKTYHPEFKPNCEPTYTADGKRVIITEEWIKSGMVSGVGIKRVQAKVLGVNTCHKGWLQGLIGCEISKEMADEYMSLKFHAPEKYVKPKKRRANTKDFLETYLVPNGTVSKKTIEGGLMKIRYLAQAYKKSEIIKYIRRMRYRDFLKTPYWKAIAEFQKYESGYHCVICGSPYILNVHHTTYKNHGNEALHLEDLITVCRECHKEIHGIKD